MDTFAIIKAKVKDTDASDFDIELAMEEAALCIQNYCHIASVPRELRFTHANMAADIIRASHASSDDIKAHEITSISVDDTRIVAQRSHVVDLDKLTHNYTAQLNKFRRMRWP